MADLLKLRKRYNLSIEIKATKEKMIDIFVKSTVDVKLAKKQLINIVQDKS